MNFVTAQPESLASAAGQLAAIGSALAAQNAASATSMTGVQPPAADEVSFITAAKFALHANVFQEFSANADAMHQLFVATLGASAGSYAATEAANAVATR